MPTSNPYYEPCPDCGMLLGIGTVKHTCGSVVEPKRENAALRKRVEELVSLTRALLESQGELLECVREHACCRAPRNRCGACEAIARAEKIQRGEV